MQQTGCKSCRVPGRSLGRNTSSLLRRRSSASARRLACGLMRHPAMPRRPCPQWAPQPTLPTTHDHHSRCPHSRCLSLNVQLPRSRQARLRLPQRANHRAAVPLPGSNNSASHHLTHILKAAGFLWALVVHPPEARRLPLRGGMARRPAVCRPHPLVGPHLRLPSPCRDQHQHRVHQVLGQPVRRCRPRLEDLKHSRRWASIPEKRRIRTASSCKCVSRSILNLVEITYHCVMYYSCCLLRSQIPVSGARSAMATHSSYSLPLKQQLSDFPTARDAASAPCNVLRTRVDC